METTHKDIVIIGAGITGLTTAFYLDRQGVDVHILERSNRVGGQIQTFHEADFTFESGPNTSVVANPEVAELFSLLAPDCTLETARASAKRRLIWKGNRFHPLPSSLWGGICTPLFTLPDKFRLLGEPFRTKGTNPNESVGELAIRRMGRSFFNYAVDPFVSGIYAGNPMKLTTQYALPKLYNLEQQYGSFICGAIAKAREPKTDRDRLATKEVFSAVGGLEQLVAALTGRIGRDNITLSANPIHIHPEENGQWRITYTDPTGEHTLIARKVITTVGAYSLPELLPFIPSAQMNQIANLHYAPMVQVAVGLRDTGNRTFNAFGGLVPSVENKLVLGILFPSACFPERVPQQGALLSFFLGGVNHPEILEWTDEQIRKTVEESLHTMLGFPAGTPIDMFRVFRHPRAIPQYEQNSGERFSTISRIEAQYPGLILAGNIRNGIGLADRIRQATIIAEITTTP